MGACPSNIIPFSAKKADLCFISLSSVIDISRLQFGEV